MSNLKYLSQVILKYLPDGASLLSLTHYYNATSIIEADIDGDSKAEVVVLYEKNKDKYIAILKDLEPRLELFWNSKIQLSEVSDFKSITLKTAKNKKCILLGGIPHGKMKNEINLLEWRENSLNYMLPQSVYYDKVYGEDLEPKDGIDELIIWTHQKEEAYDIRIYDYCEYDLIETHRYDYYYFKAIKQYYHYLCETYPEEAIYEQYLTDAKEKVGELEDKVFDSKLMPIVAMVGYIEQDGCEEDIYLIGKVEKDESREYINQSKIIYTTCNRTKRQVINLPNVKFYYYKLFLGDFTGLGIESLCIQLYDGTGKLFGGIYTIEEGRMVQVLDLEKLGQVSYKFSMPQKNALEFIEDQLPSLHYYLVNQPGELIFEDLEIGNLIKVYPVDENDTQTYLLYCTYPIRYKTSMKVIAYLTKCFKWQDEKFTVYRRYVTDKE